MKFLPFHRISWLVLFVLATLMGGSSVAVGQSPTPGFRATIPAQVDKYGTFDVTIENRSKLAITAAHVFQNCHREGDVRQESRSTGHDSLETFSFSSRQIRAVIDPGATQVFYVADIDPTCPMKFSVLFSDGHGEGSDDSLYGWQQMIADRYSVYDELLRTKKLIEAIDPQESDFIHTLLGALESRRSTLDDRDRRDVPKSEVHMRELVLDPLLMGLRESEDRMPAEVKTREAALELLERWMLPLRINGYDKRPLPKDSPTPNDSPSAS
jgi:hypothetical protein